MSSLRNVKLHYFQLAGAAEMSRILLRHGGVQFEDIRYTVTRENGQLKGAEYEAAKASGAFRANMDRVPVMEVNGIQIGQSKAIERFIANNTGMFGANDEEKGAIDCVVENLRDIKEKYFKVAFAPDSPEKTQQLEKWFAGGELAEWLVKLEHSLPVNASGAVFVVGNSPSYADLVIWQFLRFLFTNKEGARAAEEQANCTRLSAIADKVQELEAVKKSLV
jgi:glutathione S-transferase